MRRSRPAVWGTAIVLVVCVVFVVVVTVPHGGTRPPRQTGSPRVVGAVAAENFYGNVIEQLGGVHVSVTSILSDPSADPHSYESSPRDAGAVAAASIVVQNGLGYDDFMGRLEAASPNSQRTVIDVGAAMGRRVGDNPHQWYDPTTMGRMASLITAQLVRRDPTDRGYFRARLDRFDASLARYSRGLTALGRRYGAVPVAVTEPVFGYALAALHFRVLTPHSLQLAVQEGNDPSPQDVQAERNLLADSAVKFLAYNEQAVEPLTESLLPLARAHHVPIVAVYETMPRSQTYQGWMLAELSAVERALATGTSTERIV